MLSIIKPKKVSYGKKLFSALAVFVFTVFTIFFFSPLEIFLGNIIEFKFSATTATIILSVFSFGVAVALSCVVSLLPAKVLRPINLFVFALGVCTYLQSILLNGSMGSLTGDEHIYSSKLILSNIAVWIFVFALIFTLWIMLQKAKKSKLLFTGMRFISIALVAMQLVGFLSLYVNIDKNVNDMKNNYFTDAGKLEVSENENTIYFIIDTCDGALVEQALVEYPDMFDGFNGFTYFPNMTTTHSRTYPSIPYLLSGEICYFDKPYTQYVNEAFEKSSFIEDMDKLGTDIRVYTEAQYIGESVLDNIDNHLSYDSSSLSSMNFLSFVKQAANVSAYRGMPYLFKKNFEYTSASVNDASMKALPNKAVLFDDVGFCSDIKQKGIKVNKTFNKTFRMYHMFGTHPGASISADGQSKPGVSQIEATRGCLFLIEQYITQMKKSGTFDNSTIIITADHGFSSASQDLNLHNATSCIMMVKPAGTNDGETMKTSLAPVCHEDLFATIIESLGGDHSKYGRTIWEIGENEERERKYYHTTLFNDLDGEVALREYSITGDARDLENYHLTGKYWDVNYSERAVSKHRLNQDKE